MVESDIKDLREGKKKYDVGSMVDRISGLPDEILVSVLSLLSLKEAQATSILSRRWQYVWAYCITLNFDAEKILVRFRELDREARELERCRYVNWVDSVLKQHRAVNIELFRVAFNLGPRSSIDEWIQLAMRKGVQMLELDFSAHAPLLDEKYTFSGKLFGIGETSGLESSCSEYIGFKCLKVLDLKSVEVDQVVLEYFISNCPVLERLAVYKSYSLVNLRVVGQSIALKYIVIQKCFGIESIEISDANLVSFIYEGGLENLLLRNVPLLVEISLLEGLIYYDLKIASRSLSCCLSQLEILKLKYCNIWCERDPVIPKLPNLKRLELEFDDNDNFALLHLASFIKESPCLHTLVLKLIGYQSKRSPFSRKRAAKCSHDCLKVVEIVRYGGRCRHNELVMYMTKAARYLEKIVLDSVGCWCPRIDGRLGESAVMQEGLSRAQARQLKKKLSATVEVVCL